MTALDIEGVLFVIHFLQLYAGVDELVEQSLRTWLAHIYLN